MSRRRRPRLYLRGHMGCLGCSLPLLADVISLAAAARIRARCPRDVIVLGRALADSAPRD